VPQVLEGEYPNLGRSAELDATTQWAIEMLQAAASVDVTVPSSVEAGDELAIAVRVVNHTGHKLPTGYPEGRRMWLDVAVRDASGATVWRSGEWDPATGALAPDPQLKVYEVRPGIWDLNGTGECDTDDAVGNPLFHFVLNDCIALDNRIPPEGFSGMNDIETRPVNYSYPETAPGSGVLVNFDITEYAVSVPASEAGDLTVEATLRYQTASDDYVRFLRDEAVANGFPDDCIPRSTGMPTMSRGELLFDIWTRYDRSPPIAAATASTTVTVSLFADGFESSDTSAWTTSTR
jgi:hypothetical protein